MLWKVLLLVLWLPTLMTELVQNPPFVKVSTGDALNITCTIEGAATSCFEIVWFIQRHTEAPQRVDTNRRFTSTGGTFLKECHLFINNTMRNDSGTYYCSRCSYAHSLFGKGTKVIVSEIDAKPLGFILPPSQDEIATRNNITLICLVYDPSSDNISISWNVSGTWIKGHMGSGLISSTGDYSISNHLTMQTEKWRQNPTITCIAEGKIIEYHHSLDPKDAPVISENVVIYCLGAMIPLLFIILVVIVICYQKKLKQASQTEDESTKWENRVNSNNSTVIYQAVKSSGGEGKGKKQKKNKKKQGKHGERGAAEVHYACLELQNK